MTLGTQKTMVWVCDFTYLTNPPWFYQAKAISSDSEIFGMNDPIDCFANIEEAFTS